ncbi:MAG TPA: MTAP family purine nucleoside phosphorylase [Thermoleophilia bacterium]|nr:MTAP family purine nucleoside phosphorylase [Thermoleophilia bacterium]
MSAVVPAARLAVVGGSATQGAPFPGERDDVQVLETGLVFDTPYGDSPPFQLFALAGQPVLHVRMHGWRPGLPRGRASRQVFWVLAQAGVERILSEAGVGSLNHLLDPGDLVVCDDFVDMTSDRAGEGVVGGRLLIMREPVCPVGREALLDSAGRLAPDRRLFRRGTYVVTEGPRFESPAEVRHLQGLGDVVGQSFSPEVWLARDIGAHYAGIYLIVNYGEGVVEDWSHTELKTRFTDDAALVGGIVLDALTTLASIPDDDARCRCRELRPPSLLR